MYNASTQKFDYESLQTIPICKAKTGSKNRLRSGNVQTSTGLGKSKSEKTRNKIKIRQTMTIYKVWL